MRNIFLTFALALFLGGEAMAALTWAPNATDRVNGAIYTIKGVWEWSDGYQQVLAVEVNENVSVAGCTPGKANTFFYYSNPVTPSHQIYSNKLTAAHIAGQKIRVAINPGTSNWCHTYGYLLWGLEIVVTE